VAAEATRLRRDAAGRPTGEHDRHGAPLSVLEWRPDGSLRRTSVRLPDGGWVEIEPGAGARGPWGASDLVTRDGRPLTRLTALDWARVDRIPAVAEPARLPAGAGAAILNLLAQLAVEQGVGMLRYEAPYPTEALFLTLLESFRYVPAKAPDPRAAFASGALAWTPTPHEVDIEAGNVWVQRRERIEKIVAAGRTYYRPDWQGVRRLAPRAVRDAGDTVRASLMALGRVIEDHLVLAADGSVLETPAPGADPPHVTPLAAEIVAGLVAITVATSAPPLGPWLVAAAREVQFAWGPVHADLVATVGTRVTLSHRLRGMLTDAVRGRERADALAIALGTLREAADLVADALRARAQTALAAEDAAVQAAALDTPGPLIEADARAIAVAAEALAREAARA
jgi:YD repeat-containing protein